MKKPIDDYRLSWRTYFLNGEFEKALIVALRDGEAASAQMVSLAALVVAGAMRSEAA